MYLYLDQFSERHDFPLSADPAKVIIIASTGRCGSHMLGHAMYHTGAFGFPLEYANPANLAQWRKRFATTDLSDLLRQIQRRRTSPNGVFGIKIHYGNLRQFGGFANLQTYFPNAYYVHLSRSDVLRQAVSLSIAEQTGVWIAGQKSTNGEPHYDYQQIHRCLRKVILENASWQYTLAVHDCRHIQLNLETVRSNISGAIQEIADFMDVRISDDQITEGLVTKEQSTGINQEWVKRFLAEFDESELLPRKSLWPSWGITRKMKSTVRKQLQRIRANAKAQQSG